MPLTARVRAAQYFLLKGHRLGTKNFRSEPPHVAFVLKGTWRCLESHLEHTHPADTSPLTAASIDDATRPLDHLSQAYQVLEDGGYQESEETASKEGCGTKSGTSSKSWRCTRRLLTRT